MILESTVIEAASLFADLVGLTDIVACRLSFFLGLKGYF